MLAVNGDLADKLSSLASADGQTLYGLANRALESFIMLRELGFGAQHALELREELAAAKSAGFVPCPEVLWHGVIELASRCASEELPRMWFEAGARFAKLIVIKNQRDPFAEFHRDFVRLSWGVSEITIEDHV